MIMDSSKAKQAKSKAKARTKQSAKNQEQSEMMGALQMAALQQAAAAGGNINPEIQAHQIAMQDKTATVNPYHNMGMLPNNYYNPGNVIGGGYVPGS
jgi:hypothetical protein